MRIVWHDSADAALAARGLALAEEQQGRARLWRLERLAPPDEEEPEAIPPSLPAPPGLMQAALAEADRPEGVEEALGHALPDALRTAARFEGTSRNAAVTAEPDQIAVALVEGTLHTALADRRTARLRLSGSPQAVFTLADRLLGELPCAVPAASLAAEALDSDAEPSSGPPRLPPALTASAALAWLMARLAQSLVALVPAASSGTRSEPVHQMRVALRRLRTAMTLLKPLLPEPAALAEAARGLRALARVLGPAREWDVFLEGTGRTVAAAFPENRALARLLKAASRRRASAYADLSAALAQPEFRRLMLALAALAVQQPWQESGEHEGKETSLAEIAPALLQRRYRKLLSAAAGIANTDIATVDAARLHAIRLRAKRVRYAAELLSPLFPRKEMQRFIRRLVRLQDRLGGVNDAASVDRLLGTLGASGSGEAGGIVRGFVAAIALEERTRIEPAWRKFRKQAPFWA